MLEFNEIVNEIYLLLFEDDWLDSLVGKLFHGDVVWVCCVD